MIAKGRYRLNQFPASPLFFCLFSVFLLFFPLVPVLATDSRPEKSPVSPHPPSDASPYLSGLLKEAERLELHKDRYWLTLLHHKKTRSGSRSLVDDPKFFLAPDGRDNAEEELKATIAGIFRKTDDLRNHPVCRFVARYDWLREKLKIEPSRLPHPECIPFNGLMENIRPESVTLVFPTAHINSPASMFGHTLLTIDTNAQTRLLSQSINYSAVTTETFGPLFAVRGLFGSYKGYFSVLPYYAKLQEYSDIERRDLWEYRLNFSKEEIRRLLMHTYEMDFIYSDYYFFDENCSYNLLFLLDAARPSLDFTDRFGLWVIPLDTIRAVRNSGLVADVQFRPSRTARIEQLSDGLSRGERLLAASVAGGESVRPTGRTAGPSTSLPNTCSTFTRRRKSPSQCTRTGL